MKPPFVSGTSRAMSHAGSPLGANASLYDYGLFFRKSGQLTASYGEPGFPDVGGIVAAIQSTPYSSTLYDLKVLNDLIKTRTRHCFRPNGRAQGDGKFSMALLS